MVTKEQLVDYVRACFKRGADEEYINQSLASHGWTQEEINEALYLAGDPSFNAGESLNKESSKILLTVSILISLIIILSIFGVTSYFVLKNEPEEQVNGIVASSKCETNGDCGSGFRCEEKKCIEINMGSSSGSSGSSSGSNGGASGVGGNHEGGSGASQTIGSSSGNSEEVRLTNIQLIDCGSDLDCFIKASANCELVKAVQKYKLGLFGIFGETNIMEYQINGIESGKCVFYLEHNDEKEGVCKINGMDLVETLKIWKTDEFQIGTFSDEVWKNSECSGSYFS